jgi:uncharacterized protein (DUF924 family)
MFADRCKGFVLQGILMKGVNMEAMEAKEIVDFWFGEDETDILSNAEQRWQKDPAFDRAIEQMFKPVLDDVVMGMNDDWLHEPEPCLAYIIVLDQFTRNIFRDTPQMFAQDNLALAACEHAIDAGHDKALHPIKAWFLYMPLMHSENLAVQEQSLKMFRELADRAPEDYKPSLENAYDFAVKHADIVKRFSRYPHRNSLLGRESTAEELEFLKQPGSSF